MCLLGKIHLLTKKQTISGRCPDSGQRSFFVYFYREQIVVYYR